MDESNPGTFPRLTPYKRRYLSGGFAWVARHFDLDGVAHYAKPDCRWCEVMGGPAEYTATLGGYPAMHARHRGLAITPEQRRLFVALLSQAADEADLPADLLLIRLATIRFQPKPTSWEGSWSLTTDDVRVEPVQVADEGEDHTTFLVAASCPLEYRPKVTAAGLVVVPDKPRAKAEEAIETVANLIAVALGSRRSISSVDPAIFLKALTESARQWLDSQKDLQRGKGRSTISAIGQLDLGEEELNALGDRLDGAALMVEAMGSNHATGRFHEFIRLFERAFKLPPKELTPEALAFLDPLQPAVPIQLLDDDRADVQSFLPGPLP